MPDVTQILLQIEQGDAAATDQLWQLVYAELRTIAAARLSHEKPGQTLQTTALVHEAYLRMVGTDGNPAWNSRERGKGDRRAFREGRRKEGWPFLVYSPN